MVDAAAVADAQQLGALLLDHLGAHPGARLARRLVVAGPEGAEPLPAAVDPVASPARGWRRRSPRRPAGSASMSRSPAPVVAPSTVASCRASSRGSGPRTSRVRASHGRVEPCSSRVPTVTTRAMTTSWARSGVSSGRVSAAARVTTPRMPAQEPTMPPRSRSRRSASLSAPARQREVGERDHPDRPQHQADDEHGQAHGEGAAGRELVVVDDVVEQARRSAGR